MGVRNLLYLVHRLPYPPDKGDKIRSFHLLNHLTRSYNVFLGTFVDDPDDFSYIDIVKNLCFEAYIEELNPIFSRVRSLTGLIGDGTLSVEYYRSEKFKNWVSRIVAQHQIDVAVVFSSAMAQYVADVSGLRFLVDFVDVDSAKWSEYAHRHRWPMSWLYRREGEKLLAYEAEIAEKSDHSFFVTENEVNLFRRLVPSSLANISALNNGVDSGYFSQDPIRISPYLSRVEHNSNLSIAFTGAMDYLPNIDAVLWFSKEILPALHEKYPQLLFYIVGRNPSPAVLALASEYIIVTGTVLDVRPYLQYATVIVAPLRVARGIQNKILEAMSMARAVVASTMCVDAIDAVLDQEIFAAETADDFVLKITALLESPELANAVGVAGRLRVLDSYSWTAHLSGIDTYLDSPKVMQVS